MLLVWAGLGYAHDISSSYGIRMAESVMLRHPNSYGSWHYETGTVLRGFEMLYKATGDKRYFNYIKSTVDSAISADGSIATYDMLEYNLDLIKEGSLALYLYAKTGDSRYAVAAKTLMTQLKQQPRTSDGGNWHKLKYPTQMWLDGLYMAQPFNVQYGVMFNAPENLKDAVLQFTLMEHHARDRITGLLYHGWDESGVSSWADPVTGTSPEFWGRSLGWYAMALVDVLDFIPRKNYRQRAKVLAILKRLAVAITSVQDSTSNVWWQVINKAGQSGNWQESSVTAMVVYSLAKAIRLGYLKKKKYLAVVKSAWAGLVSEFITENSDGTINLIETCEATGVGPSYDFYIGRRRMVNDPKGVGPFIMAAVEMELLPDSVSCW
jgi:unsaturated rhamnogalacturonyl hydrolase